MRRHLRPLFEWMKPPHSRVFFDCLIERNKMIWICTQLTWIKFCKLNSFHVSNLCLWGSVENIYHYICKGNMNIISFWELHFIGGLFCFSPEMKMKVKNIWRQVVKAKSQVTWKKIHFNPFYSQLCYSSFKILIVRYK